MASPILYLPHGGGPLPLLGEQNHLGLIQYLQALAKGFEKPKAILVISAHWEETLATLSSSAQPAMYYDYYGFPAESYQLTYPALGEPKLAKYTLNLLESAGIQGQLDPKRGFDHATFVPLKLLYPQADIPVVQLSLTNDLEPEKHIELGEAIAQLAREDVLLIGSGLSFHNLQVLMNKTPEIVEKSQAFDQWLNESITSSKLNWQEKQQRLIQWQQAPHARFAHPREEHLLPLHVCFGAAKQLNYKAENNFDELFLNTKVSGFIWQNPASA